MTLTEEMEQKEKCTPELDRPSVFLLASANGDGLIDRPTSRSNPMKRMLLFALVLFFSPAVLADDPPKGFRSLFNGQNLTGWKATGEAKVWGAEKGVIFCQGGGGGWLMTEKEYGDFELHVEYKMPKGGNSGVGIRAPLQGDPAYAGMEIQLIDDVNWPGKLESWQHTGSIYNVVPAAKIANRPIGEWNRMRIVADGPHIRIEQNGEKLVDANLKDYVKEHAKRHPGILRKAGHIGLQSYNTRVEFRNLYIMPLVKGDR